MTYSWARERERGRRCALMAFAIAVPRIPQEKHEIVLPRFRRDRTCFLSPFFGLNSARLVVYYTTHTHTPGTLSHSRCSARPSLSPLSGHCNKIWFDVNLFVATPIFQRSVDIFSFFFFAPLMCVFPLRPHRPAVGERAENFFVHFNYICELKLYILNTRGHIFHRPILALLIVAIYFRPLSCYIYIYSFARAEDIVVSLILFFYIYCVLFRPFFAGGAYLIQLYI